MLTAGVLVEECRHTSALNPGQSSRYSVTEISVKTYFYSSGGAAKSLTELSHVSVATSLQHTLH